MKICPQCSNEYKSVRSLCETCRKRNQRAKTPGELAAEAIRADPEGLERLTPPESRSTTNPTTEAQLEKIAKAKEIAAKAGFELIEASTLPKTEFISTGHGPLDEIIKGFPRKRITEIFGPSSVGKTTLMLQTIAQMPAELSVLYIDTENAVDAAWTESVGITAGRMKIANPIMLEDAADYLVAVLRDTPNLYDLIVFDSVAAVLYRTEDDGDTGQANVGVKAKVMNQFIRKLNPYLFRSHTALVFINQERKNFQPYGEPFYTPGGDALPYAASMRLRLSSPKKDRITREGEKVGKKVTAELKKNKVGAPDREASFIISY